MSQEQSCHVSVKKGILNIALTQKSSNPRMLPCSPDPSAFVVALAHCTREEIKGTPVGCGLFLCRSPTVGDRGLKEQTVDGDSTGSPFAAHTAHSLLNWSVFN